MYRRQRLQITTPPIPTGAGGEAPDSVRIYLARAASDPGPGSYNLQATDLATTRILQSYNSGIVPADSTSNSFPSGNPGKIKSGTTGWELDGDGTIPAFGIVTDNTTFTISGGGSATYSGKHIRWVQFGLIVCVWFGFTVTANGSGSTTVGVTSTGLPNPAPGAFRLIGDRSVVNVNAINVRFGSVGEILAIARVSGGAAFQDSSAITGADLVSGQVYSATGIYFAEPPVVGGPAMQPLTIPTLVG
jgi:hypothetical protein